MIFRADPNYIAQLDSLQLVKLMKLLLIAEARLTEIPLRAATVPLQITVPDGGEDGRVNWIGSAESTPYFPARLTVFQAKAQNLTPPKVKREVLTKSQKGQPETLNTATKEVLANAGAYIIFCRQPMTEKKRETLRKTICQTIKGTGANPKAAIFDVYDANLIADWVNRHPSVALWLATTRAGWNLAGFQTHEGWSRHPDMVVPWKPGDEPRFAPANRVVPDPVRRAKQRNAWTYDQASEEVRKFLLEPRAIVRIYGPSGFGKSRFAFEALNNPGSIAGEIIKTVVTQPRDPGRELVESVRLSFWVDVVGQGPVSGACA